MSGTSVDAIQRSGSVRGGVGASATNGTVYDVAVVGFGPSGAVAAALLAQHGLTVHVCDRQREVYDKPRAIAIDHEILRVFQQLGLLQQVLAHAEPFTPSAYIGADGRLIKRMTMVPPPYPLGHVPSMVFTQPPVERALRAHVAALPGVTVALGTALKALAQDEDGVTLQLGGDADSGGGCNSGSASASGSTDLKHTVRARHVIGCDGASSTVRACVGIGLDDLDFDEPWLVVDVLVNDRGMTRLPTTSVQYCEPGRPCTYVIGPGRHRRWEIALMPGEDPLHAATAAGTWALLARWIGPDDGELWRQASYRFHALVARRWRAGRVFIAGDAAHQQPPFLGQGMCQGIRDVANLAWKLAAVQRGKLGPAAAHALLDSYGIERGGHVRELTRRIKAIGALICERDPVRARERDERLLAECGGVVPDTPRQDVMPRLEAGCLSSRPGIARGTVFPQPWVALEGGGSALLDDAPAAGFVAAVSLCAASPEAVGRGPHAGRAASGAAASPPAWRLVCNEALADAAGVLAAGAGAAGAADVACIRIDCGDTAPGPATPHTQRWRELHGVVTAWMRLHGCHAALVRPDHVVFGVASTTAELRALLQERAVAFASDRVNAMG